MAGAERKDLDLVEGFEDTITFVWDVVLRVQQAHGLVLNMQPQPTQEEPSGHDIVSALYAHCSRNGIFSYHCAMTSHDVKEFAFGVFINDKLKETCAAAKRLRSALLSFDPVVTVAKTHGAACKTTTWQRRFSVLASKLPQHYPNHTVRSPCCGVIGDKSTMLGVFGPEAVSEIENILSERFSVCLSDDEFQIQHRSSDWAWCSFVGSIISVLESLCWMLRLAARDGIASIHRESRHVASSAMPHKNNPVEAEMAQGRLNAAKNALHGILFSPQPLEEGDVSDSFSRRTITEGVFKHTLEACDIAISALERVEFLPQAFAGSDLDLAMLIKNGQNRFAAHADLKNTNNGVNHTIMFATQTKVDVLRPNKDLIHVEDIALGLSRMARFNGQTKFPYSVASHCVLVFLLAKEVGLDNTECLAALLHDAHEAYIGDLIRPIYKKDLFFSGIENNWANLIASRFGFENSRQHVNKFDRLALYAESHLLRDEFLAGYPDVATKYLAEPGHFGHDAEVKFLSAFREVFQV